MASVRLTQLQERIKRLRLALCPAKFSDTGDYSVEERDRVLGFRLLAHAEIEHFLEEKAQDVIVSAKKKWDLERKIGPALLNVVAFHSHARVMSAQDFRKEFDGEKQRTQETVTGACNAFINSIKRNHGIKDENIFKLLLPLGVSPKQIDPTWLGNTHSFASDRGPTAHSSAQTYQLVDPKGEVERVDKVIEGLEAIDALLEGLIA